MTDHQKLKLLVTGEYRQPEFVSALHGMQESISVIPWQQVLSTPPEPVDFLFVAQARRGQFSQAQIYQLVKKYPLTSKALILGSWCEGETRSGQPLRGIKRVYLQDWPLLFQKWQREWLSQHTTQLARPATETLADETDAAYLAGNPGKPEVLQKLRIGLHSQNADGLATLSEACARCGWDARKLGDWDECDLLLVDCCYSVSEAIRIFETARERWGGLPVVAICGFCRPQDRTRLRQVCSHSELLGKPFDNLALQDAIAGLCRLASWSVVSDVA